MATKNDLQQGLIGGTRKGAQSFFWICRILVPVSLAMALLQWTGWLHRLDFVFEPLMGLINLPPQAALPILTGAFAAFYPALAIMVAIPFTPGQMTLIAIYIMIAHGLFLEGTIQHKSGINLIKIGIIRLLVATATVWIVSFFFEHTGRVAAVPQDLVLQLKLWEAVRIWALDTARLGCKIFVIVMVVMIVLESFKHLGWMPAIVAIFKPFSVILGLSKKSAVIWMAGMLFGLTYGSAIIVEEMRSETLTKEELETLHIFLGINHSIVEDPALFLALGVNLFWVLVPRLVAAVVAVYCYRGIAWVRKNATTDRNGLGRL
jgi:hypothetical protein